MADEFDENEHMSPLLTYEQWKKFCQHPAISVIAGRRSCECTICGAVVDPFDYLAMCAKKQDRFRINQSVLNQEINKLTKERDRIKRQLSTARCELKRVVAENLRKIGGDDHA